MSLEQKKTSDFGGSIGLLSTNVSPGHNIFNDYTLENQFNLNINIFIEIPLGSQAAIRGAVAYFGKSAEGSYKLTVPDNFDNKGDMITYFSKVNFPLRQRTDRPALQDW